MKLTDGGSTVLSSKTRSYTTILAIGGYEVQVFFLRNSGQSLTRLPQHSAKRAIPLKFATIEHDSEQDESGGLCIFQITTPLISYVIKAKHQVRALCGHSAKWSDSRVHALD
jgi:hypothetical protein